MATISLVYYTTWRLHLSPISFLYLPWAKHGESVNYTRLAPCPVSSVTYGSVHCFLPQMMYCSEIRGTHM